MVNEQTGFWSNWKIKVEKNGFDKCSSYKKVSLSVFDKLGTILSKILI